LIASPNEIFEQNWSNGRVAGKLFTSWKGLAAIERLRGPLREPRLRLVRSPIDEV